MATLYRYSKDDIDLKAAIDSAAEAVQLPFGLFYMPRACLFGRRDGDGPFLAYDGNAVPLNEVFEARLFGEREELRWVQRTPDGRGRAVLLAETETTGLSGCWEASQGESVETIDNDYVLWGEAEVSASNATWTELRTARIGTIHVPFGVPKEKKRVVLKAREYLKESVDGNVIVMDERLKGFGSFCARDNENERRG